MRIHGNYQISRRELEITDFTKHKTELEEDFHGLCGYCGKNFKATLCDSQIEHFIPKKKYPEYENLYSNLILACKVCNNKKRSDWPSGDPTQNITNDGKKGYIDPAMAEYDDNLMRCDDGSIVGLTDVGKYMYYRLGFDYRPIGEIHKINEIFKEIEILREKKKREPTSCNSDQLNSLFETCEDLRQQIHMKKE